MPMPANGTGAKFCRSIFAASLQREGGLVAKVPIQFKLNGAEQNELIEGGASLLAVLREKLGLTGIKSGCNQGTCGACTVLIEGEPSLACLMLAERCQAKPIASVDGLASNGVLHPLQQAFMDCFAAQCGFCTPGMILAAK